ncbi:hypothetical protein MO973_36970 [Paenibacillus sp. TRM 82003]|uniref:hypothetical protein n=1 Tax=Kineococcus sp. TRM81007 TaxID=2925831 RepID=UPI001F58B287|nr:hypothetical protein [Kineococcus sp. TRM81007]MCI2239891.1 hypothetical protein [Kineococcus sp. TRM81007]MCI3925805.1 hypothetical protein [Paenibacillus sp. TRM 82003]
MRPSTAPRPARRRARALLAAAAIVATLGTGTGVAPVAQAAISPVMSYDGASVNNARIPAEAISIETATAVEFDRGTYWIGSTQVGTIDSVASDGTVFRGTGTVDLAGRTGSVTLVARLYKGKYMVQKVYKVLRLVPPVPLGIPAGWPNADTTGVPAGKVLQPVGDLVVTTPGTVLDGLDIGCLTVRATDVVVRNSRVTCTDGRMLAVALQGAKGFVMEDSEIDGGNGAAETAIGWGGYTLRRVEVRGTQDGPRLGYDVTVVDSWVHGLVRDPDVHTDAMQSTTGARITVRHNTLDPRTPGVDDFLNAAVQLGTETGNHELRSVLFENNYFNGGTFSVNVSCDARFTGSVVFRGNRFGHGSKYGPVIAPAGVTFTGNTWVDTGAEVPVEPAC